MKRIPLVRRYLAAEMDTPGEEENCQMQMKKENFTT